MVLFFCNRVSTEFLFVEKKQQLECLAFASLNAVIRQAFSESFLFFFSSSVNRIRVVASALRAHDTCVAAIVAVFHVSKAFVVLEMVFFDCVKLSLA